jgi:large subunit ribosomal protein L35
MPKMKSHSGAKKRFKITATGKYVAKPSGTSHILTNKNRKRKNRLNNDFVVEPGKARKLDVLLANKKGR